MKLSLIWNGPVGAGAFPGDPAALEPLLEHLMEPGVYLRVKRYDGGRTVSYVGQSKTLLSRFDQHLTQMLGLQYAVRDGSGNIRMSGGFDERLHAYGDMAATARLVSEDVNRMRFYWAPCGDTFYVEDLSVVEAALKQRLETVVAARNGFLVNENIKAIPFGALDEPIHIENDFTGLEEGDRDLLNSLLGADPIVIDPGFAELEADADV